MKNLIPSFQGFTENCKTKPSTNNLNNCFYKSLRQGGRGHWTVCNKSPKFYNNVFLFVVLTTLETFIEFVLVVSLN